MNAEILLRIGSRITPRIASRRRAVTRLEIAADLRVGNVLEACGAERGVREERRKFEEREAVRRKHVEGISEKFLRARAEAVEAPALAKNFIELADADEVRLREFQWVEPDGVFPVRGRDEDQPFVEMFAQLPFAEGDDPEHKRRHRAVDVEEREAAPGRHVLLDQVTDERTLAATGLSEDRDVHRPRA